MRAISSSLKRPFARSRSGMGVFVFADSLANKGIWKKHTGPKGAAYKARAMDIIGNIWSSAVGASLWP